MPPNSVTTGIERSGRQKLVVRLFSFAFQLRTTFRHPIYVALGFIPIAIALKVTSKYTSVPPLAVLCINIAALIPLAHLTSCLTDIIAKRSNQFSAAIWNVTFGNVVELLIATLALKRGDIDITRLSLLGSMLSNMLLVLPMACIFGGWRRKFQYLNRLVVTTFSSLLLFTSIIFVLTTLLSHINDASQATKIYINTLSRVFALILLFLYFAFLLIFQGVTHKKELQDESPERAFIDRRNTPMATIPSNDRPEIGYWTAITVLVFVAITTGICSQFLLDSIDDMFRPAAALSRTRTLIGLVVLPFVGNATEHVSALFAAWNNKIDLAIGIALGSSLQIGACVLPVMVLTGWAIGKELTLIFDAAPVCILLTSTIFVWLLLADGKTDWLKGLILLTMYILLVTVAAMI